MGDSSTKAGPAGASPKKLVLIGVLAVVLIAVLYVQFVGSSKSEAPEITASAAPAQRPSLAAANSTATGAKAVTPLGDAGEWLLEPIDRPQWKSPELARVIRYDPFALPAAFPQPVGVAGGPGTGTMLPDGVIVAADTEMTEEERSQSVKEIQTKLAELKERGVRVIIKARKEAVAVIGDRTVHVGDDLEGFTVKAIQSDGVVVERKLDE
ncbi:MAG: hypothetical protein WD669_08385 [Pirellulales bacterium]